MSLIRFAKDLEKFGCITNVSESIINIDFEDIKFYIQFDDNLVKVINKVYRAKQYEINFESKYQVSNLNVEFQIFHLSTWYSFNPFYELIDENLDKVILRKMSLEYRLNLFQEGKFNFDRVIRRVRRRHKLQSEVSRKRNPRFKFYVRDLFLNSNTITYIPHKKMKRSDLIEIGKEKVKACLFKLAVIENDCWELKDSIKGKSFYIPIHESNESEMLIPKSEYNDDLIGFYKVAKSSLFASQAFLSYYHVLEYNFLQVADEELYNKSKSVINAPSFNSSYKQVNKLLSLLKKHERNLDETNMLIRVINKYVDEEDLIDFINKLENEEGEKIYSKPQDEIFGERIFIKLELGHTISNVAKAIKHIRNFLVHSSDKYTREECVIPFSESETVISRYIPIARFLAEKIIYGNAH